jgi:hypothetical protein
MPVRSIDHVLIAMPAGREDEAAEAYKSIWGVEKDFVPARKAHLAFIVDDLAGMATKVKRAGYKVPADDPSKDATDVVSTIRSAIRSS